ncbi:hypothetical protein T4D_11153 [Trichinella pseudospiralis]|uniref:Uncharacterized protein n=1 Tax=Trichinella pseudospiralis TaxID=6337 RepID=A0A0V1ELT5_TRIPS|nr:hypothetical protein T4D_11153 [Trichinella pseudospiralis]
MDIDRFGIKPIYSSEKFENFEKMLFFQLWTKWILIDSE